MTIKLDLDKLEQVKSLRGKTTARCPACAERRGDRKGEHLVIYEDGAYGCVIYPKTSGDQHGRRKHLRRIRELLGSNIIRKHKKSTPLKIKLWE